MAGWGDDLRTWAAGTAAGEPASGEKSSTSAYHSADEVLMGSGEKPGIFGGGLYSTKTYKPNKDSFVDPYSDSTRWGIKERLYGVDQRSGPQMTSARTDWASAGPAATYGGAYIDQGASNEARKYSMDLAQRLRDQSMGIGPSLAGEQLKSGYDQMIGAQLAAAGSQKGFVNPALAAKGLQGSVASSGQQLNQQAALARMQEQLNAQQQLAGVASGVRAQDLGVAGQQAALLQQAGLANAGAMNQFELANAGFKQQGLMTNAGFEQQTGMANMQAMLEAQRQKDAMAQFYVSAGMSQNDADRAAAMQYEKLRVEQMAEYNRAMAQAYEGARGGTIGTIMGIAGMAGGIGGLSDEKQKVDVKSGEGELKSYLSDIFSHSPVESKKDITAGGSSLSDMLGSIGRNQGNAGMVGDRTSSYAPEAYTPTVPQPTPANAGAAMAADMDAALKAKVASINAMDQTRAGVVPEEAKVAPILASSAGGGPGTPNWLKELGKGKEKEEPEGMSGGVAGKYNPNDAKKAGMEIGKVMSMIGSFSDEKQKTGVAPGEGDLKSMLSKAGVHEYSYKDPSMVGAGPGRYVSPMAQELEKTKLGKDMVLDTPQGKMVDYGKGFGTILSAEAMNHGRLKKLEEAVFGGKKS